MKYDSIWRHYFETNTRPSADRSKLMKRISSALVMTRFAAYAGLCNTFISESKLISFILVKGISLWFDLQYHIVACTCSSQNRCVCSTRSIQLIICRETVSTANLNTNHTYKHVHAHIYTQIEGIMHMRNLHLNFTTERQRWEQTQINGSKYPHPPTHTHIYIYIQIHTHTQNKHVMRFGFVSRTMTHLKSTEKENITLLTISIHCTFFRVNRNALINLKWQPKASGKKAG